MKKINLCTILVVCLSQITFSKTTIALHPTQDAAIGYHDNYNTENNNYGTAIQNAAYCIPGANGGINANRALMKFDLRSIPLSSTIISAKLNLYATGPSGSLSGHMGSNNSAYLQKVSASWDDNTITWKNQPTTSTVDQVTLPSSTSSTQDYLNIDVTTLVQNMHSDTSNNYGFMLRLVNEITTNALLFYSKDHSDTTKHPVLTIIYADLPEITLKPLQDAAIGYHDNYNTENNNYGTAIQNAAYWIPGASGGINANRALIKFDLSSIPFSSTITSAKLNLYATGPSGSLSGHTGSNNSAYLQKVTASWDENTVTWNNQPTTSSTNQVTLAASTSQTQDYLDIDVSPLIQEMHNNPSSNHGLMLKLVNEVLTNGLLFCSKNHSDTTKHPKLIVTYSVSTPSCSVDLGPDREICLGENIVLTADGDSISSYLWSTGDSTSSITVNPLTNSYYAVTTTHNNGCQAVDSLLVTVKTCTSSTITPICIVGVDSVSNKNIIIWEKPLAMDIDSFIIYKETNQSAIYAAIGAKAYEDFSTYIDSSSDPRQQAYLYKLATKYISGQVSDLSIYHKTVHLSINKGIGNTWNLNWNHYEGFSYSSYNIYRGTRKDSLPLLTTISSSLNSYTDLTPPTGRVYYQIEVVNSGGCSPAKKESYSSSKSNIVDTEESTFIDEAGSSLIHVYPNPNNGEFVIEFVNGNLKNMKVSLMNTLGQSVYESGLTGFKNSLNLNVEKGIYLLRIQAEKESFVRKIIVN